MTTQKTTVDWLTFRAKETPERLLGALKPMFGTVAPLMGLQGLRHGSMGFLGAAQIVVGDMPIGRIDWGGDHQRGWARTAITGKGCEWVQDWDAVQVLEDLEGAEIRRLDLALTTWRGEVSHDRVVAAHTDGRFKTGGRPPALQQITSSDPRAGRTCYVGDRKSDKYLRGYEKGYELAAKARAPGEIVAIDGCPIEGIYRVECEFKAKQSVLPWEAIERRDQYFTGAYPFCSDLLPEVECDILMRRPERAAQMSLKQALRNCQIQYGSTLFTAMTAYEGDMTRVWDSIIGDKHNEALLADGVLLVEH